MDSKDESIVAVDPDKRDYATDDGKDLKEVWRRNIR